MKKSVLFFIILTILNLSCKKEQNAAKETTRMERVIAIHDEVMPKMGTIGKLISALEPKIDSSETVTQYKVAKDNLEEAYTYMMDWMKGFGDRFDSDEILKGKALSEQKEAWLIEEEEKVNIMRDKINNSISLAKALLNEEN